MSDRTDVIVIGAGLTGLSCAIAARERGMTVRVLEAESVARHASSASAGGVRSLNRHPAEIPLARAALTLWPDMRARVGHDCGFRASGQLRVAEDEAAEAVLRERLERMRALGHEHERWLSAAGLQRRVPGIARHCHGALAVDDDGFADPLATVHALHACARRLGITIDTARRVVSIEHDAAGVSLTVTHGDATHRACGRLCVNAAGAWGGALADRRVPMRTAALQMSVTAPLTPFLEPVLGSEGRKLSLKQTAAGALVIGGAHEGTIDAATPQGRVLPEPLVANLAAAVSLFPTLARARVVRSWTGLEGMVTDGLPVIGESVRQPNLVHAFGFSAHGFALVPLLGTLVADLLEGRRPSLELDAFAITRFDAVSDTTSAPATTVASAMRRNDDSRGQVA